MAILKNIDITLKDDTAKMSEDLFFYQNDSGISVRFSLKELKVEITRIYSLMSLENSNASMTIVDPDGLVIQTGNLSIVNNMITLEVSPRLTSILGEYRFQIHLHDSKNGRLTLPPCSWQINELIGANQSMQLGVTGVSSVGECYSGADILHNEYDETKWEIGDIITPGRLNKIEKRFTELDDVVNGLETSIEQIKQLGK